MLTGLGTEPTTPLITGLINAKEGVGDGETRGNKNGTQ